MPVTPAHPTIVCLCGSTRFSEAFRQANLDETLAGKIVLSIGCDMRSDAEVFAGKTPEELEEIKANLDELHKRKIDVSDEVLILDVGGYIGQSTLSEIMYARAQNKRIRFLTKPLQIWDQCPDCGVKIGEIHNPMCDVERCPRCGGQIISCDCGDHPDNGGRYYDDGELMPWSGVWPGDLECREYGFWSKWTDHGWEECSADDPDAKEDLNRLAMESVWDATQRKYVLPTRESDAE